MLRILALATVLVCVPATALAHVERPSYWPDPAPDTAISPAAGGAVPKIRSLESALDPAQPGETRVVCQKDSLTRAIQSINDARQDGYFIRPEDHRSLTTQRAQSLLAINRELFKRCEYEEIQPAVMASGNHDRVVVMPGLYTEPSARRAATHDPACDQYEIPTEFGDPGALSYAYQVHCPNDQNLIAVLGREIGPGADPSPPAEDRHGIPNLGPCVRCNLQLEGSGVSADDVIVEAGDPADGNGRGKPFKDVAIRADRADGFVLRNLTTRHAREDGIYVIETDGYVLDRFKAFYNGSYGTLTFVSDHGLHQDCEGKGHSDSAIYPGAAPETGQQRRAGTPFRYNQAIRRCSLHHNLAGYSGTNGNAVQFTDNDVYDNALGIQTDVVTAAGHPGFPGDSAVWSGNRIHANNFNPYLPGSDVGANFPFPVGTGMWIAGGNHHTLRDNFIYDNWRRGAMLYTVPDALICGPAAGGNEQAGCDATTISTSHYNEFSGNHVGISPDGEVLPNGTDFWWDSFPGSRGNCWFGNVGPRPVTSSPLVLPDCDSGKDPERSVGTGDPVNQAELIACLLAYAFEVRDACPWFVTPARPGSAASRRARRAAIPGAHRLVAAYNAELADLRASSPRSLTAWGLLGPAATTTSKPLGQFTCRDWRRAGATTRLAIVRRLTVFNAGRVDGLGWGSVLGVQSAKRMFNVRCAQRGSKRFLLYKLYGFTAGFLGGPGPAELLRR